jgi:hypothetical protein
VAAVDAGQRALPGSRRCRKGLQGVVAAQPVRVDPHLARQRSAAATQYGAGSGAGASAVKKRAQAAKALGASRSGGAAMADSVMHGLSGSHRFPARHG